MTAADASSRLLKRRSEVLKERFYVTFTLLAVTIAVDRDIDNATVAGTAVNFTVTVLGVLGLVFIADVVAHLVTYALLPSRDEMRHMVFVSFGSLSILIVPGSLLLLAAFDVLSIEVAVRVTSFVLVGTLAVITFISIARIHVPARTKVVVLVAVVTLGLAVLALETFLH